MTIKNILHPFIAGAACCCLMAALTACSSDDPFFSAGEDDAPRILNTDIPQGTGGQPGQMANIERTQNFTYEAIVTPANYTTVTWYVDDDQVAEGLKIDMPLLAGDHIVKMVARTTKGLETSRTFKVVVRPAEGDPSLATDARSRWLTIGAAKTIECTNATGVTKVFVGKQEASNVSFADNQLTFTVPNMAEGEYMVSIADATGMRYGCGLFTVSKDDYVAPDVVEEVLWEGSQDINWGDSNVLIASTDMAGVPVGATILLYYEMADMPDGYHAMRITTSWWGDNPEDQVVPQFDLTADTPNPYEFTYTEANKAIVDERGGMLIVGYGYKATRVTYKQP